MVESNAQVDVLFYALSDSTRRSILARVAKVELSISEIAHHYKLTFAAISKHIQVLEKAGLVAKRRQGKEQIVMIVPATLDIARGHIEQYAKIWVSRYNKLEILVNKENN
jgi:DNA-binding transcriptional ArsR family regulator